jgi:hypothetical protein
MNPKSIVEIIKNMTDVECKQWLLIVKNKEALRTYWAETYDNLDMPSNVGEILYVIKYDVNPICENGNHKKFKQFPKGYYTSCNKAVTKECACLNALRADRSNHKPYDREAAKLKCKRTMLERYGVDNAFKMDDHSEKTKNALDKKYGQPTLKGIAEVNDKKQQTTMERYGVKHFTQSVEYKQKVVETNLEKYGVEFAISSDTVKEKSAATMLARYGVDNYFKSKDHQATIIADRVEKLGYENIGQRFLSPETYAILQDPVLLKPYIEGVSYEAAALALNTSAFTIATYVKKYNFLEYVKLGVGSAVQDDIQKWLTDLGIRVIRNCRTVIPPKEIDLWLPDFNLGIEYNGIYYHTEVSGKKDRNYHRNKFVECSNRGIILIQICSVAYKTHKELVKSLILSKIGISERIFARKCVVKSVSFADTKSFLSAHHLQDSSTTGKHRYGLYYNNELVQLMTFGKMRKSLSGIDNVNEYELIRMATKQGCTIVGGASKLFNAFCKENNPTKVISYCDLRYFTGNSLANLGFIKQSDVSIGYWYTDYKKIYHRYNFAKYKLVEQGHDPSLSEWEIMQQLGYDRIWDCGQAKWEWNKQ